MKHKWIYAWIYELYLDLGPILKIPYDVYVNIPKPKNIQTQNVSSLYSTCTRFYIFLRCHIIVLGVHCGIYKSSYNISQLDSPPPSFSFIPFPPIPGIVSPGLIFHFHPRVHNIPPCSPPCILPLPPTCVSIFTKCESHINLFLPTLLIHCLFTSFIIVLCHRDLNSGPHTYSTT
jgi:hypothetical protein